MVETSCQDLWERKLCVKPEPALERSDQSSRFCRLKDPREDGCLLVWALPQAKRVDGNLGSEPFLGEWGTVAPGKIPLAGDWKVLEGARGREPSELPCVFAWKSTLNCCQNNSIKCYFWWQWEFSLWRGKKCNPKQQHGDVLHLKPGLIFSFPSETSLHFLTLAGATAEKFGRWRREERRTVLASVVIPYILTELRKFLSTPLCHHRSLSKLQQANQGVYIQKTTPKLPPAPALVPCSHNSEPWEQTSHALL